MFLCSLDKTRIIETIIRSNCVPALSKFSIPPNTPCLINIYAFHDSEVERQFFFLSTWTWPGCVYFLALVRTCTYCNNFRHIVKHGPHKSQCSSTSSHPSATIASNSLLVSCSMLNFMIKSIAILLFIEKKGANSVMGMTYLLSLHIKLFLCITLSGHNFPHHLVYWQTSFFYSLNAGTE